MITNLYAKYLLADRLNKVAEAAGVDVALITVDNASWSGYTFDVHFQTSDPARLPGEIGNGPERAATRLLDAMPQLTLERSDGLIFLLGTDRNGLAFRFYTGSGSCELVQIGTRTVPAREAMPEREEPVFEKRCIDPLAALISA